MFQKCFSTLFRISVVAFLLGGLAIVLGQTVGLILGDGVVVTHVEELLAPYAYGAAGIAGLLSFVLSYFHHGGEEDALGNEDSPARTAEHVG
ncbi:hypothetical protein OPAG_01396 [Rhodococcus opacus PD630]|uniref:hypothetical protein n=1 Tax=Rhodococcus TaxID=1827 RepID=UPI00029CB44B|nr:MULTISPECIES: hypothetical protein [Rhodococcus]KXF48690.1 hypothetical protein AXA44_27670 [Rhodococcus sp. SC4]NDV09164.1 hypothetical protein [Rhodococcus sp. IEGM 248]AHK34226.1 hypothetical protein Pd630_LPD07041 [Rhodococcus opacus PD630]EHI39860.1 hypothetical protein OPAG_01396 [Rhodococcus opacus PD630]KXX61898.1 hypothetical protein AZG88_03840 [Rhodococcus sp. LB1]